MNTACLTLALSMLGSAATAPEPASLSTRAQSTAETMRMVQLERTPCYGACPVYKVTIQADGTVFYQGFRHVERIGAFTASVAPEELQNLLRLANTVGYWRLKDGYSVNDGGPHVFDMPGCNVTLSTNRRTKTVTEYGDAGPIQLWTVQKAIDGILMTAVGWTEVKPGPDGN